MALAYSIELPVSQESLSIGEVQVKIAKTFYPDGWEFWQGREALFDHLISLVWSRVSLQFPGKALAAREVLSILKNCNESAVMDLLPQLSGKHFYHVYLAAANSRLLHRAIATGEVERIKYNPTGTVTFDLLADSVEMVTSSDDRISIRELANYLKQFHIALKKETSEGAREIVAPVGTRKQPEGVNDVRGRLILEQLESLGYDPMDMEYELGAREPGVKDEVRERIWELRLTDFRHRTKGFNRSSFDDFFNKAWQWLSESELISHLPVNKK